MSPTDIEQRPIVVSKVTLDLLLKEKEKEGLTFLYLFYYYTAVWQGTDRPKCTTTYAATGTGIGIGRIKRLKKRLTELKLIKSCIEVGKDGKVIGHFVKVNYCHTRSSDAHPVVNRTGNALKTNNKSVHTSGAALGLKSSSRNFFETCVFKLEEGIRKKKKLTGKMTSTRRENWRRHFNNLFSVDGVQKKRIQRTLKWYIKHMGVKYVPVAYTGQTFREKFIRIEDAMKRSGGDITPTDKANKIANWAYHEFGIVNGTDIKDILPSAIEKSLQNYRAIRKANFHIQATKSRNVMRIATHLQAELFEAPTFFMRTWLREIPHWNLTKLVFDIDHQTFTNMATKILMDYTGEKQEWQLYKKVLNENIQTAEE